MQRMKSERLETCGRRNESRKEMEKKRPTSMSRTISKDNVSND